MVIESTVVLTNRMKTLLTGQGYRVNSFKTSGDALEDLKSSRNDPYALIISSYMMPRMKGDEILKLAREIMPDAQRLLIADTSELQTLISAINLAGIHSCLTLPFRDEDFINRVRHCCDQYETMAKQKNLKRFTQRQNRQLFQMASNFKKKGALYFNQLEKKNKEIRILESRIMSAGGSVSPGKPVLLKELLTRRNIGLSPDSLSSEFSDLRDRIKHILEAAVSGHNITLKPVPPLNPVRPTPSENKFYGPAKTILNLAYNLIEKDIGSDGGSRDTVREIVLDDQFELILSKGGTHASLKARTPDTKSLSLAHVKQFLEKHGVINGVKDDPAIESWLHKTTPEDEPFAIARGREPKPPKDAIIRYHFPVDFLHAGKVNKDGSINFMDRGEIPYVEEDAFLAAKIFPEPGAPGIDIFGREIPVKAPLDMTFSSGPGTRISEDGVRIYAQTAGQPHLDAMGNISVCPEFQIKGDLGFETGDVNFDGNVIVNGTVKQGFKVKCASLTAREIQGAQIDIAGDLNVSLGIVDTELVKVKGSVQAKFIHNSKINAFGDLIVQKEIIDSKIYLSGACINETGSILNCEISAKMGIRAGSIGNKSSRPSTLTVGVDEHTNMLVARVDARLNVNNTAVRELTDELKALGKEDQRLHAEISKYAYIQDRSQLELKDIEKKLANLKASGNMAAYQKVSKTIKVIQKNASEAEERINRGFDLQDGIALETAQKEGRIREFKEMNKVLLDEKKRLLEFSKRKEPLPEVKVGKQIESGTRIFGTNASLTLYSSSSRCRIREFSSRPDGAGGMEFHEMRIDSY